MIYFAQAIGTTLVKIGYTAGNPRDRVAALQTGCPHKLELVALQQVYFKTRTPDALATSKRAEKALRKRCGEILHPERTQPALFDDEPITPHRTRRRNDPC